VGAWTLVLTRACFVCGRGAPGECKVENSRCGPHMTAKGEACMLSVAGLLCVYRALCEMEESFQRDLPPFRDHREQAACSLAPSVGRSALCQAYVRAARRVDTCWESSCGYTSEGGDLALKMANASTKFVQCLDALLTHLSFLRSLWSGASPSFYFVFSFTVVLLQWESISRDVNDCPPSLDMDALSGGDLADLLLNGGDADGDGVGGRGLDASTRDDGGASGMAQVPQAAAADLADAGGCEQSGDSDAAVFAGLGSFCDGPGVGLGTDVSLRRGSGGFGVDNDMQQFMMMGGAAEAGGASVTGAAGARVAGGAEAADTADPAGWSSLSALGVELDGYGGLPSLEYDVSGMAPAFAPPPVDTPPPAAPGTAKSEPTPVATQARLPCPLPSTPVPGSGAPNMDVASTDAPTNAPAAAVAAAALPPHSGPVPETMTTAASAVEAEPPTTAAAAGHPWLSPPMPTAPTRAAAVGTPRVRARTIKVPLLPLGTPPAPIAPGPDGDGPGRTGVPMSPLPSGGPNTPAPSPPLVRPSPSGATSTGPTGRGRAATLPCDVCGRSISTNGANYRRHREACLRARSRARGAAIAGGAATAAAVAATAAAASAAASPGGSSRGQPPPTPPPPLPTASSAAAVSTAAASPATTPRTAVLKTEDPSAPTPMVLDPFPPQPLSSITAGDIGSSATSGISASPPTPPPPPPPTAACTPVLLTVPTVGAGTAWESGHGAAERMAVAAPPRPRVAVRSPFPPAAAAAALAAATAATRPAPAAPAGHPPSRRRPPVSLSAARVSTVRDAALALSLSRLSAAASEALDGGGRAAVRDALLALARKAEGHGPPPSLSGVGGSGAGPTPPGLGGSGRPAAPTAPGGRPWTTQDIVSQSAAEKLVLRMLFLDPTSAVSAAATGSGAGGAPSQSGAPPSASPSDARGSVPGENATAPTSAPT